MALTGGFSAEYPGHSCDQLFALASDVERYPAFIPWCRAARVLSQSGEVRQVDNSFGAGPVEMRFRSRAAADPPHRLEITSADGPFRAFRLVWTFAAQGQGCRVRADYTLDFRSPVLQGLARLTVAEVERRVERKFRARARELYG